MSDDGRHSADRKHTTQPVTRNALERFLFPADHLIQFRVFVAIFGTDGYLLNLGSPQNADWYGRTGRSEGPYLAEEISLTLNGLVVDFQNEITDLQFGFLGRSARVESDDKYAAVGFIRVHAKPGALRFTGSAGGYHIGENRLEQIDGNKHIGG